MAGRNKKAIKRVAAKAKRAVKTAKGKAKSAKRAIKKAVRKTTKAAKGGMVSRALHDMADIITGKTKV